MDKSKPSAPYKVLYLNSISAIGGAEMSLLAFLQKLNRRQFEPLVILPERGPLYERIQALGIKLKLVSLNKIDVHNPLPYLKTVWSLARILRSYGVDILHCNMDICNQYSVIAARLVGVPIVTHTRNILGRRAFRRMFLSWADVLIANSRAVADSYAQYISSNQRVEIIYNGVDIEEFHPDRGCKSKNHFKISNEEIVIGQIAQITPNKGQDVFIRALAHIVQINPHVRVLIVGDTIIDNSQWFLKKLKQLVQELGLNDKIIFTGFVEDIVDLYQTLDMVVVPSQIEGFNRTLIEAMAMAKPVIATDSGGPLEIVVAERNGLLVPYGNPEALARAILRLMDDPQLLSEFGANGRRRVEEQFSIEKSVKEIEQVYMSLIFNSQDKRENHSAAAGEQR